MQPKPSPQRSDTRARPSWWVLALIVLSLAATVSPTRGEGRSSSNDPAAPRRASPEDRYALAGGCYAMRSAAGPFIARAAGGFRAGGSTLATAEPFHFQATDLGRYLLFGKAADFLAVGEGAVAGLLNPLATSSAQRTVGGLTYELTDKALYAAGAGAAGTATGRGSAVVAATQASHFADWELEEVATELFILRLPVTNQVLAVGPDGGLVLQDAWDADQNAHFGFRLTHGCTRFPEIDINAEGPVLRGDTPFSEVRGFVDAHVHMMAYEFIGGRIRCGRPWHRYGVAYALVDCPDHEPGGRGGVIEAILSGANPGEGHDTGGWPTFAGWPRHESLTHEQMYYRWLERAWRGGLRLFTNLLVDNHALCVHYPYGKNSCNEMDGVRLQAKRLRELERYIDAQSGGPGEGWFRIVTDPFQARRVINAGKLAVVMGIEVSLPFDCGILHDIPLCDADQIDEQLDEVYALGVRQMELANKFDNALTGITGDEQVNGVIVNYGNRFETGRYWQLETCPPEAGKATDKTQYNLHDEAGTPDALTGRDSIFAAVLQVAGTSGVAPAYPPAPHCNVRGLSALGEHAIRGLISRGMIFDPDHMSAKARREALEFVARQGYSGVVSSHSWADDTNYQRIYRLGGIVTSHAGGSQGFVDEWRLYKTWADPRYYFGFGFGSDVNGFSAQGGPRENAKQKVTYPFKGFGGVVFDKQRSGERVYDINADGVAHYGLYPDWVEDLRVQAGDAIVADLARGAEAFLQMWERAVGVPPDACRSDVADLTETSFARLRVGATPEAVLRVAGQPASREGTEFRFCVAGGRTARVTFSSEGRVRDVAVS